MSTIATLIIYFRENKNKPWVILKEQKLTESSYIIGRSTDANICLNFRFISRYHCVLLLHDDLNDYVVRDGTLTDTSLSNPNPICIPSTAGTYVKGRKLELNEKCLLQNGDEVFLTQSVKLVYIRPQNKISDGFDDTITSAVEATTDLNESNKQDNTSKEKS